jgi:hypothetical protein
MNLSLWRQLACTPLLSGFECLITFEQDGLRLDFLVRQPHSVAPEHIPLSGTLSREMAACCCLLSACFGRRNRPRTRCTQEPIVYLAARCSVAAMIRCSATGGLAVQVGRGAEFMRLHIVAVCTASTTGLLTTHRFHLQSNY